MTSLDPFSTSIMTAGSYFSGQLQNNANANASHEARKFASKEAQKQRDWTETMSNTAMQRKRADSIAAGVNPILSMTDGGGAITGSGASADTPQAPHYEKVDPLETFMKSQTAKQLDVQNKKIEAEKNKTDAETENTKTTGEILKKENKYWSAKQLATLGGLLGPKIAKALGLSK